MPAATVVTAQYLFNTGTADVELVAAYRQAIKKIRSSDTRPVAHCQGDDQRLTSGSGRSFEPC